MLIYRSLVKDRDIAIEDLLGTDPKRSKIRYSIFEFSPQTYKGTVHLAAYQDEDDARAMHTLLLTGWLPPGVRRV